ncbi:MAG: hypothetical protein U1C97_02980 [Candidatus Gracilibacteria bacterium]|nr:hypothetical protein [Candidatus Gracilibacteria bacterium]
MTAVTSKNTHHYRIGKTRYHFHHVRQELFTGFRSLDDEVFIAVPEKALLDYCYLRHPGSDDMIFERFNREKAVTLDISLLKQMAALYPPYVQHFVIHLLDVITGEPPLFCCVETDANGETARHCSGISANTSSLFSPTEFSGTPDDFYWRHRSEIFLGS